MFSKNCCSSFLEKYGRCVSREIIDSKWMFLFRGVQSLLGGGTLVLSVIFLSVEEIGLFQTMNNVASLYLFFEMGLPSVLVGFVAKKYHLRKMGGGDPFPLIKASLFWYLFANIFFLIFSIIIFIFFKKNFFVFKGLCFVWGMLVFFTSLNFMVTPLLSALEGMHQIAEVCRIRILGLLCAAVLLCVGLYRGLGLWVAPLVPFSLFATSSVWLVLGHRSFLRKVIDAPRIHLRSWMKEIWPLQWRSAVGWFSGYAQLFIHVPLLCFYQGPREAGQMGISMTLVNTLSVLALSFPTSQISSIVKKIHEEKPDFLDLLLRKVFLRSMMMYGVGALILFFCVTCLQFFPLKDRILSFDKMFLLLVGVGAYHGASVLGILMRSHLQDSLVRVCLGCAFLTICLSSLMSPLGGSAGHVWVIFFVNVFLYFPLSMRAFKNFRGNFQKNYEKT